VTGKGRSTDYSHSDYDPDGPPPASNPGHPGAPGGTGSSGIGGVFDVRQMNVM
jgi:hypothetical protein